MQNIEVAATVKGLFQPNSCWLKKNMTQKGNGLNQLPHNNRTILPHANTTVALLAFLIIINEFDNVEGFGFVDLFSDFAAAYYV